MKLLTKEEYETLARALAELNNMADVLHLSIKFNNGTEVEVNAHTVEVHGVGRGEIYGSRAKFVQVYEA